MSRVGIVIVSHSARLAAGVCEVAAQMAPDVVVLPAGGADDGGIGTSFEKILAAMVEADSGAGVVLLYDLGSAKMSAELAAETACDTGRIVRLVDAPLVEGAIAAAVTAQGGASLDAVAADAERAGGIATSEPVERPAERVAIDRTFTLRNPLGLHARPAARLARVATEYGVTLRVGPAEGCLVDARSVLATVALGLRGGSEIRVEIAGDKAREALSVLQAAIEDRFGENASESEIACAPSIATSPADMTAAAAPGIAIGPIRRIRMTEPVVPEVPGDPATERSAFDGALARVDRDLAGEHADIAEAHRVLLADPQLVDVTRAAIAAGLAAAPAWWRAVRNAREPLAASSDDVIAQRAVDVTDVGLRVLSRLAPERERAGAGSQADLSGLKSAIVVAEELTPSMVGKLADAGVAGIVLARGGVTAHSAVVARGRGVPMLVRAGERVATSPQANVAGPAQGAAEGTLAILDGDRGTLILAPDATTLEDARARQAAAVAAHSAALETAHSPVFGRDGRAIVVAANVASRAEAHAAREQGADAIGLLRTEMFFVNRTSLPTEDEQIAQLTSILEPFAGREVTIRTLDIGGDKDIPALALDPITHGFLGLRGLRYSLAHPETLRIQLRAIMRAAATWNGTLSVMAPMVSTADEVLAFRAAIAAAARSLEGQPHRRPDHVGIMVEVPAAAIAFDTMVAHVDFVSVGTNDLVQYVMAAERTNASVANLYQPHHAAVWRVLEWLARAASEKKIAVCGEMAAYPEHARRLVDLGVRELSMAPASIPNIKAALRVAG